MPSENVGFKTGISMRKQTLDDMGKVVKTVYFFPDLGVSVKAASREEARKLAEKVAVPEN